MAKILHTWSYTSTPADAVTVAAEANAVLRNWTFERNKGTAGVVVLIREWPDMDAQAADDFAQALTATVTTSATMPMADGQVYGTTGDVWNCSKPEIEGNSSRAVTVVQTLTLPNVAGVRKEALTVSYKDQCSNTVRVDYYRDNTLVQYQAAKDLYSTSTDGVTVRISPAQPNRHGSFDYTITTNTVVYRDVDTAAGTFAGSGQFTAETIFEKGKEWREFGVTTQTPRSTTRVDGYIKRQDSVVKPDCSEDVTTDERESQVNADVRNEFVATWSEKRDVVTARNEAAREVETATQAGVEIVSTSSELNPFGRFDNTKTTKTAIPKPSQRVEWQDTTGRTIIRTRGVHDATPVTAPGLTPGTTSRNVNTVDEFGQNTTDEETVVHHDLSISAYSAVKTQNYSATREKFKNKSAVPALTEPYGSISYAKNDVGRYDGTKMVVTYYAGGGTQQLFANRLNKTRQTIEKQAWAGATEGYRWRTVTYTFDVTYHSGESAAWDALDGQIGNQAPQQVSAARWRSINVKSVAGGTWQTTALSA